MEVQTGSGKTQDTQQQVVGSGLGLWVQGPPMQGLKGQRARIIKEDRASVIDTGV